MRRREFIALLCGATAWPLTARAQHPALPQVGFVHTASPETVADRLRAFRLGLKETGYVEDDNVRVLYRFAENQNDRAVELVAELVRRRVVVIATLNNVSTLAAKAAAPSVPIVFSVNEDPVRLGLVGSLARPGGNMTGINFLSGELVAKRLELLRELIPGVRRLAMLVDPTNPTNTRTTVREIEAAGGAMGLKFQVLNASTNREIDAAFVTLEQNRPDALIVSTDGFFVSRRVQIAILAAKHSIIAFYGNREPAEAGGLISYGTNISDTWRQVGVYVGRILKGAKPADLPVVQPSKFELIINAQTARSLGLVVPSSLLARADEVIE